MRPRTMLIGGVLVLGALGGGLLLVQTLRYGFSAKDEPTAMEAFMATTMRRLSVPADLRDKKNPRPLTADVLAEGRAHFADHCATCHGNDGKGETSMGPNFYPKVPDMTKEATQSQSDGALFATIENGIRLTAMPAFGNGTGESAAGSWGLVHFIRHLPKLTPEELEEMKALNPKTAAEWAAEQEAAAFLEGGEEPAAAPRTAPPAHSHH